MKLTAAAVQQVYQACLCSAQAHPHDVCLRVLTFEGECRFDLERIDQHREQIKALLQNLPEKFKQQAHVGLEARFTRDHDKWGDTSEASRLLALGQAAGLVTRPEAVSDQFQLMTATYRVLDDVQPVIPYVSAPQKH